jgi:hypothetical protein
MEKRGSDRSQQECQRNEAEHDHGIEKRAEQGPHSRPTPPRVGRDRQGEDEDEENLHTGAKHLGADKPAGRSAAGVMGEAFDAQKRGRAGFDRQNPTAIANPRTAGLADGLSRSPAPQAGSLTPTLVAFDRQPATAENSFEKPRQNLIVS